MLVNQPPKPQPVKGNIHALDARVKDSMPWWGSGLAIAAAAGYWFLPDNIATVVAVFTSVGLALGHDLLHPAISERWTVILICNIWARETGHMWHVCSPKTSIILTPVSLFVITSSIGWARWGQSRRRSASIQLHTGNMLDRRADWHIVEGLNHFAPGIEHESIVRIPRGFRWTWKIASIGTEQGLKVAGRVLERLPVPRRFLRLLEHEHSDKIMIEYTPVDTLVDPEDWKPVPSCSIIDPLAVARDADGGVVMVDVIDNHVFAGGMSRAGKTAFLEQFCAWAVAATDARLVIVDSAKGCKGYGMWRPHAMMWAPTIEDARKVLATCKSIAQSRYLDDQSHGSFVPTDDDPQIILVVDEGSDINADKVAKEYLQWIARSALGAGITLVTATQHPHFQLFPKDVLANIEYKFAFRCKTVKGAQMIITEWPGTDKRVTQIPKGGYCYVSTPDYDEPMLARTWFVDGDVLEGFAATHKPIEALAKAPEGSAHDLPAPQPEQPAATVATVGNPQVNASEVATLQRLTGTQERIRDKLREGPMSDDELAAVFGVSRQAINKQTVKMAGAGVLVKAADGRWEIA